MKLLILMTNRATLHLLNGEIHPSGFWAEEFVVPYKRFKQAGYDVDIATIDGIAPTVDKTSVNPRLLAYIRPTGIQEDGQALVEEYLQVIASVSDLKHPLNVSNFTKEHIASYDGIYLCGGHGAIGDMPKSDELAQLLRWVIALNKPIATVCHGHCGLLALRDGEGNWPFANYHMTAFSHDEELVTDMAGRLPFVLERELRRLGALYEKADIPWDSHVVVDRNLVTGQNPFSSADLAEAFIHKLSIVAEEMKVFQSGKRT
jgi:putative intracellular protease/amidase